MQSLLIRPLRARSASVQCLGEVPTFYLKLGIHVVSLASGAKAQLIGKIITSSWLQLSQALRWYLCLLLRSRVSRHPLPSPQPPPLTAANLNWLYTVSICLRFYLGCFNWARTYYN